MDYAEYTFTKLVVRHKLQKFSKRIQNLAA